MSLSYWQTEDGKRLTAARSQALHAATKRLKEEHADEYANLLREERVARGLPAESAKRNAELLQARVNELEAELKKARA